MVPRGNPLSSAFLPVSHKQLSSCHTTIHSTPSLAREVVPVQYRGFEIAVVRTIPKGWVWSVKHDRGDKIGNAYDREEAIRKAKLFINNLLRRRAAAAP